MVVITLAIVGAAVYYIGKEAGLFTPADAVGELHAYIQAPPVAYVGQEMPIVLTVQNDTDQYLSIDELRLPNRLLDSAQVASIIPGTLNHKDYTAIDGSAFTGYEIGFLMAPGDRRDFQITLLPQVGDDIVSDFIVVAGDTRARTGFRVIFEMPVAEAPTNTPQPTWTMAPSDTPEPVKPTATPITVPYTGVVKLTAKVKYSSYLKPIWGGSGTIVSSDGLILTNAHLVTPGQGYRPDIWVVSITDDPALPPTDMYYAEPLIVDEDLDLAVMHITSDLHYKPVALDEQNLKVVPLGDSSILELGESLAVIGYPGIGGETITLTRGDVGGFTASNKYGERSFIKTSASISAGSSGGMAMDQFGRIIGIPTQLGYGGREETLVDCRVIADTNGDGNVDTRDICLPVGGFINAIRPINLAIPLIEQAKAIVAAQALGTLTPDATEKP